MSTSKETMRRQEQEGAPSRPPQPRAMPDRSAPDADRAQDGGDLGLLSMREQREEAQRHASTSSPAARRAGAAPSAPRAPALPPASQPSSLSSPPGALDLSPQQRQLLQRWLLAVGCVTFDLERGPELEFLAPSLDLTTEEKDAIAFSSFPDTAIFDSGKAVFSWRMRTGCVQVPMPTPSPQRTPSEGAESGTAVSKADSRRSSSAKRRSFFRIGSDSSPAPPCPEVSNSLPSAPGTSSNYLSAGAAASMGRSQSAITSSASAPQDIDADKLPSSPESNSSRLNGSSSHGAMHTLFKLNTQSHFSQARSEKEKEKDKEKAKEPHRNHFREFVHLLSRPQQQQQQQQPEQPTSPTSDTSSLRSPPSRTLSPFAMATRNKSSPGSSSESGWVVIPPTESAQQDKTNSLAEEAGISSMGTKSGLVESSSTAPSAAEGLLLRPGSINVNADALSLPATPFEAASDLDSPAVEHGQLLGKPSSHASTYIYGFVFFQQRPDPSIRRGYFQKSFVLLSSLPLLGLWTDVVERIGEHVFKSMRDAAPLPGDGSRHVSALNVCKQFVERVCGWSAPSVAHEIDLPFFDHSIKINFSYKATEPEQNKLLGPSRTNTALDEKTTETSLSSPGLKGKDLSWSLAPRRPITETLRGDLLSELWLLWECLLIGEPIIVLGPEPCAASTTVWHLQHSLIQPLRLGCDVRPYMNLNDRDFANVVNLSSTFYAEETPRRMINGSGANATLSQPQIGLLGVTNPFFVQSPACSGWTLLRVGTCSDAKVERPSSERAHVLLPGGAAASAGGSEQLAKASLGAPTGLEFGKGNVVGLSAGGAPAQYAPGVTSRRKRRVHKDRHVLKQLVDLAKEGYDTQADALIRTHFEDLTRTFLAPLDSFFAKLVAEATLTSTACMPVMAPAFDQAAFLAYLKTVGSQVVIKSRVMNLPSLGHGYGPLLHHHGVSHSTPGASSGLGATRTSLYLDFIHGPNFAPWWAAKWREAQWETDLRELEKALRAIDGSGSGSGSPAKARHPSTTAALETTLRTVEARLERDALSLGLRESRWRPSGAELGPTALVTPPANHNQDSSSHQSRFNEEEADLGTRMMRGASKISDDGGSGGGGAATPSLSPPRASRLLSHTQAGVLASKPTPSQGSKQASLTSTHTTINAITTTSTTTTAAAADAASESLVALYFHTADDRARATLRRIEKARARALSQLR